MSYASIQAIREGAGLLSRSENETPAGAVNASNRAFTVKRRPIVDTDNDDIVTIADVLAYVNGVSVPVSDVEASTGVITLETAPAGGTRVTVTYSFSPISDSEVERKQSQADSWVDRQIRLANLNNPPSLPLNPVPGVVATAAELYAAGIILTRDWGGRADTEQTSKDGFAKIRLAKEMLADYVAGLVNEEKNTASTTGGSRQMSAVSDGDVFPRELDDPYCDPDEWFMRRKCL